MRHEPTMYGLAQYDLDAVRTMILEDPGNVPAICFHSQQAAEKILKDKLIQLGIRRRGHDLVNLMDAISIETGIHPGEGLRFDATRLTDLYFSVRYGDDDEPLTFNEELSEEAYEIYINNIRWADSIKRLPDGSFVVSENRRRVKRSFFGRFRR